MKIKKIAEDALICTPDTASKKIVTAFVNNIDNISDTQAADWFVVK